MRQINLISKDLIQELNKPKIQLSLIISVAVIIISIILQYGWFAMNLGVANKEYAEYLQKETQLTPVDVMSKLQNLDSEINSIKNSNAQYSSFLDEDSLDVNLLSALSNITESKVWFESLSIDKMSGECKIKGFSYKTESVSEFVAHLKKLSFFKDVALGSVENTIKDNENIVSFEVTCKSKIATSQFQ